MDPQLTASQPADPQPADPQSEASRPADPRPVDPGPVDQAPVDQARRLVRDRFPDALAAVLAGSTARGRATAGSDLDIAVLVRDDAETRRETLRFEGRLVELFVHTRAGLAELFAADAATRRAVLQNMYLDGLVLTDPEGEAARARALAEADLRQGPPPLAPEAVETKRYGLTDALDDLADTGDPFERLAVAAVVLAGGADLLLDHHRAWTGGGKWLPRRLLAADPERGGALLEGHRRLCASGEHAALAAAAAEILDLVGGPLREGYRRTWRGVIESVAVKAGR
ncbi:nucleotidyltransferase domain-containing protein [Kitasatospora sp. NBC_00240]|uniref:nucleotidyltransferase domain-containing protein n=1 Tax=Kitasatospora sp. NBC_00240 TaxID=2903567 RepID=UPI0022564D6C|nr:nucleotidyltransferase domain-containing protein [Kitasatospora sp. NBC_00240]MCX5209973.1 nucleotidyltransferase domain-containing protein [Kitasatospora sp. NBC_00240]